MLQYDNSAFYFFCLSTVSFYLIPSWIFILKSLYNSQIVNDKELGAVARTTAEETKATNLKSSREGFSTAFYLNVGLTIAFSIIFLILLNSVVQDGEVNSFDPFSILEIDHGSDSKAIKKAFRSLSLKYHPDKNPNNRVAEAKFMMVAKAYEALTDETAKENYEKFGNPDGKQSLEVSIGLPSFLLQGEFRNLVLVGYLIFMVVIIPFAVWSYYSDSSKYGEKNIMYDTYSWYHYALSDTTLLKALPEILAGSAEFRDRYEATEKGEIASLTTTVRSHMLKPKYNHPIIIKGNVLLHAHLLRKTNLLSVGLQKDLHFMLKNSTALLDAMISVCKHQQNLKTAVSCIEFGQLITQAMTIRDSQLLQLPHFGAPEVKHCKEKTIVDYKAGPQKGMVNFTESQVSDVKVFLDKLYPTINVTTKIYVDDDEDDKVYEGDVCTIEVTIVRTNLQPGERAGLVHAPHFPYPKREAFWVILGQEKESRIMSIEKLGNDRHTIKHKIQFVAPPAGSYDFDLFVLSNAYIGVDYKTKITLESSDNSTLPEYKVHPDDAELDDEPTLFEEMLNAHVEQDSDDDDSDEESEDEGRKTRRIRQDDDDSDSDSDAEEVYAD